MSDILVIAAHPQMGHSSATRSLMLAAAKLPTERVLVRDLYALYPDYLIDADAERKLLAQAGLLVWLHPVHWYALPPLLKLWLDVVFSFGWAYGPGGEALRGKDLWLVASTGGPASSYRPDGYNRYFFDAFMHPCEQTAALVGMRWLPPLVLHGAHTVSDAAMEQHADVLVQRLSTWPNWPEIEGLQPAAPCLIPAEARPA